MKRLDEGRGIEIFKEYLSSRGLDKKTVKLRIVHFKRFTEYLTKQRGGYDIRDIHEDDIKEYISYLGSYISERRKRELTEQTKAMMIFAVKEAFKCFYVKELIIRNPCQDIEYKSRSKGIKRAVLTQGEMAKILDSISCDDAIEMRDRAMFELMYSTGLRIGEVIKLKVGDIDFENRMVLIKRGKGGKDRVEPISKPAKKFLQIHVRGREDKKEELLFKGVIGNLTSSTMNERFKRRAQEVGIEKKNLSIHSIRHTTATHLLENGADIRYVQELLGHESIETTVVYTHTLYENLKRIYKSHHPRENEYYEEIDEEYKKRVYGFKEKLERSKRKAERIRGYYQRRKEGREKGK